MATLTDMSKSAVVTAPRPSRDWLRLVSIALAFIGLCIVGYITISEATNTATICPQTATFNCDLVQHSLYSHLAGIPITYLGVTGYLLILVLLLLERRVEFLVNNGKMIVLIVTLGGFLFSAYLTSMEAFVLHAWCVWCLSSAITMTILFIVSFVRLWRAMNASTLDDEEAEA